MRQLWGSTCHLQRPSTSHDLLRRQQRRALQIGSPDFEAIFSHYHHHEYCHRVRDTLRQVSDILDGLNLLIVLKRWFGLHEGAETKEREQAEKQQRHGSWRRKVQAIQTRHYPIVEEAVSAAATDSFFRRLPRQHQSTLRRRLKQPP